jgi:hypothetical protein
MNHTDRIDRVFAYGANTQANQSRPGLLDPIINSASGFFDADISTNGTTYSVNGAGLAKRQETFAPTDPYSYATLSPTPEAEEAVYNGLFGTLYLVEPTWGPEAFIKIKTPTWIVDGDHE